MARWWRKLLRRGPRFTRDSRAAELVEAAATLPLVITMVLAIVEFGWDLYAQQAAQQAVRHGVRLGVVDQLTPAVTAQREAREFAHRTGLRGAKVSVVQPGGRPGTPLGLHLRYEPPQFISPLFGIRPVIRASAVGKMEGW